MYYYRRLRELREDNDLVQKEIANFLGIDQRVYSNYEIGKREIPTHFVIRLADFYKTSTDYILGRTDKIRWTPVQYSSTCHCGAGVRWTPLRSRSTDRADRRDVWTAVAIRLSISRHCERRKVRGNPFSPLGYYGFFRASRSEWQAVLPLQPPYNI